MVNWGDRANQTGPHWHHWLPKLTNIWEVLAPPKRMTRAVHEAGGRICMADSARRGAMPIILFSGGAFGDQVTDVTPFKRHPAVSDFRGGKADPTLCALWRSWAQEVPVYDGVEVMGSEGTTSSTQFLVSANQSTAAIDGAGSFENRHAPAHRNRFERTREAVGEGIHHIYRLSDAGTLLADGNSWEEVVALGKAIEAAGAKTSSIPALAGMETRVPTIATSVPRAAYTWVTRKLRDEVTLPLVTTNRIQYAAYGRGCTGCAGDVRHDFPLARSFLADPDWVIKGPRGIGPMRSILVSAATRLAWTHVFSRTKTASMP